MYVSRLPKLSLFILAFAAFLGYATLNPLNDIPTNSELGDLNKIPIRSKTKLEEKTESSSFTHYDEDTLRLVADLNEGQKLKYDVEVLEVQDINRETSELEERFRGPAIKMDTDKFEAENIEVNDGSAAGNDKSHRVEAKDEEDDDEDDDDNNDDDDDDDDAVKPSHMILTMVLVFVALFSISLYVALVIWRSNLERRYGMRELLVTHDEDFYLPSSETITDRRW